MDAPLRTPRSESVVHRSPDRVLEVLKPYPDLDRPTKACKDCTGKIRFSGIRADGATGWNFSMIRNYHIREQMAMQFQAEAFNALNHPWSAVNCSDAFRAKNIMTATRSAPTTVRPITGHITSSRNA